MHQVGIAILSLNQVAVASPLQFCVREAARSKNVFVRMQLVRPPDIAGARQRDCMSPARSAFSSQHEVISVPSGKVWAFSEADIGAAKNQFAPSHKFVLRWRILLQDDSGKAVVPWTM